ncbi:YesL family protein [Radiobacillus sp. PE A8.2]|uniref:YesL family protein n=1 Tax=Radiobacillus sp. PE A8.2 TaxID=3380349 RepID=UPI00388EB3F7
MEIKGWAGGFNQVAEWIMRLAYINLLWILLTVLGLGIFGFFPATIAMFTMIRKWLLGDFETPISRTFWRTYKKEFIKGNVLGMLLIIIGIILYVDVKFFQSQSGILYWVLSCFSIVLLYMYLLTVLFFFPVFVHFELKTMQYMKHAFLFMVTKPIGTVMIVIGIFGASYLLMLVPGLIPFFGASFPALVIMWFAYRKFKLIVPVTSRSLSQYVD